jgi:hypothetical protein
MEREGAPLSFLGVTLGGAMCRGKWADNSRRTDEGKEISEIAWAGPGVEMTNVSSSSGSQRWPPPEEIAPGGHSRAG